MSCRCDVTGKKPMSGNRVSHANNKTKHRFMPNVRYKRFWLESESRWVRIRVSSAGLRLIDKIGFDTVWDQMNLCRCPVCRKEHCNPRNTDCCASGACA